MDCVSDRAQVADKSQFRGTYVAHKVIGKGAFSTVYLATVKETQAQVSVKKIILDHRYKSRELDFLLKLNHPNILSLYHHYLVTKSSQEILHLVTDYLPQTLSSVYNPSLELLKLYSYQIFRALNYLHKSNICHRDIKPENVLVNPETHLVKLCDFGAAKSLQSGQPNMANICSRHYRAPELLLGARDYTVAIDIWSAGSVLAEMGRGVKLFAGDSNTDQLVQILQCLGTPTRDELHCMNPYYTTYTFPFVKVQPLAERIPAKYGEDFLELLSRTLQYDPRTRITASEALLHPFFDELRNPQLKVAPALDLGKWVIEDCQSLVS